MLDDTSEAWRLTRLLTAAFHRSDALFDRLPPGALTARPIGLRHPFLFYLGHLPAFAWNQIGRGVLEQGPFDAHFDQLFERGIDPADDKAAAAVSIDAWPPVDAVRAYIAAVRAAVVDLVPDVLARRGDVLAEGGRIVHLVVEHERMHHETLMYMLQELPREGRVAVADAGAGRAAEPRRVGQGRVRLGVDFPTIPFGWDNEFGEQWVDVAPFVIDSLPVRNQDYLDYLDRQPVSGRAALTPVNWGRDALGRFVRTVDGNMPFDAAAGWPVQVSGLQARAYAKAHGARLPTEAELTHAAYGTPDHAMRRYPWGDAMPAASDGCFDFAQRHPSPTGSHPAGASAWGIEELVGNGWEWTTTPFAPLPGFEAYARTYPGYSADFFDGEHDVVFGASWATDRKLLRPSFRNWYRRDYPYVFSSFRLVRAG